MTADARVIAPTDERELAEAVADAAARTTPLAVAGGGTRAGLFAALALGSYPSRAVAESVPVAASRIS